MFSHKLIFFLFILLTGAQFSDAIKLSGVSAEYTPMEMTPRIDPGKVTMGFMLNDSRRKLGSFKICSLCTCCSGGGGGAGGGGKGYCLPSPCCYAINCNIPNRPFGFCSFTPKTCNCFGCHL